MRVAILGGGSCFAMNLARHYVDREDEVLSISRSPMRPAAFTLGLEREPLFRYEQAHLVNQLRRALELLDAFRPDLVVNFAALCEVGMSWKHPLDYYETNVMALVRITNALAERPWFKRFVQIGSSEVYGSVVEAVSEESPVKPSSPYAASKAAFDFHLRAIAKHRAFPAVIVMPSNGYCEGQTLNRIIPKAIIAALTGQKLLLQGGGVARKSYLHGDDISQAIMLCARLGEVGEVYNCGPLEPISIHQVVVDIADRMYVVPEELYDLAPERTGQDSQYWLNSDKIKRLGWKQKVTWHEGIDRMIQWVNDRQELLTMDSSYTHRP